MKRERVYFFSSQKEFFYGTIYPCLDNFRSGEDLLVLAYSGKTHTMQGTSSDEGVIRQTLRWLFDEMSASFDEPKEVHNFQPHKFRGFRRIDHGELKKLLARKEDLLRPQTNLKRAKSLTTINRPTISLQRAKSTVVDSGKLLHSKNMLLDQ